MEPPCFQHLVSTEDLNHCAQNLQATNIYRKLLILFTEVFGCVKYLLEG